MKLLPLLLVLLLSAARPANTYRCLPCGGSCDKIEYAAPGTCAHCGMKLVDAAGIRHKTLPPDGACNWIGRHPGALLLDVRTPEEFSGRSDPDFGALKGAINIPLAELAGRSGELAAYKNKPVLVYCSHSHRSPQAAYLLTQAGFTDVTNMGGGMSVLKKGPCLRAAGH